MAYSTASDLVVLPELFLCGYQLRGRGAPCDRARTAPEVGALRAAARVVVTAVVVGAAEPYRGGVANSAICIDAVGELAGVYRKTHLFGASGSRICPGDLSRPRSARRTARSV